MNKAFMYLSFLFLMCLSLIHSPNQVYAEGCRIFSPIDSITETITVVNATHITQIGELGHGDFDNFILSPNGELIIVTTSTDAQVYNLSETSTMLPFFENCKQLMTLAISPDGIHIATVGHGSSIVQVWDVDTKALINSFEVVNNKITSLAFNTTGNFLAWAASEENSIDGDPWIGNGSIFIYDLQAQSAIARFENVADIILDLHFTQEDEMIMFRGSYPGYGFDMQLWDIETQTRKAFREAWFIIPSYSNNTSIVALATTISAGITNEFLYQLEMWDIETDTIVGTFDIPTNTSSDIYAIPENPFSAIAVNSNATIVALGNNEGVISVWDTNAGTQLASFQAHSNIIHKLMFTDDDQMLISLGSDGDNQSIQTWGIEE